MSKTQKEKTTRPQSNGQEKSFIPERYQHWVAIGLLLLSLIVFFHETIFSGKTYTHPDTIASRSWDKIMEQADQQGFFPLWNPYIFCGMPGYASLSWGGE